MLKLLLKNTATATVVSFPIQLYLLWKQILYPFVLEKKIIMSRWRGRKWMSSNLTRSPAVSWITFHKSGSYEFASIMKLKVIFLFSRNIIWRQTKSEEISWPGELLVQRASFTNSCREGSPLWSIDPFATFDSFYEHEYKLSFLHYFHHSMSWGWHKRLE